MPKISIIVPVFNSEKFLHRCIDSILNQTFKDFECILIDDGSNDSSLSICNDYSIKDKRVKVVHKSNEGVSVARNTGLGMAKGEWIGFVDSDDWISSVTYETAYKEAIKQNADIIQWGMTAVLDKTQKEKDYLFQEGEFSFIKGNKTSINESNSFLCHSVCNKLFLTETIKQNDIKFPVGIRIGEDSFFTYQCYMYSKKIYNLKDALYKYENNDSSATHTFYDEKIINEDVLIVKKIEQLAIELNCNKKIEYHILLKKREPKDWCINNLETPNLRLWNKTFPELNKSYLKTRSLIVVVYWFAYLHMFRIGELIINLYNNFFNKKYNHSGV